MNAFLTIRCLSAFLSSNADVPAAEERRECVISSVKTKYHVRHRQECFPCYQSEYLCLKAP